MTLPIANSRAAATQPSGLPVRLPAPSTTACPIAACTRPNAASRANETVLPAVRSVGVEDLHDRLRQCDTAAPGDAHEPESEQGQREQPESEPGVHDHGEVAVPPEQGRPTGQQEEKAGDARWGQDRDERPFLAQAVDRADHIAHREQAGAEADRHHQQPHGVVERSHPQRRDEPGRTEGLAVEQSDERGGGPRSRRQRPERAVARECGSPRAAEHQREQDQHQPVRRHRRTSCRT